MPHTTTIRKKRRKSTKPARTLTALILEDDPGDAGLFVSELEHAGFKVEWTRVEAPKAFEECLSGDLDIILADYNLSVSFTAMDALNLMHEHSLDIPFIIITGVLGDENAVECIKQGAADYLLKDRLARLPMAVERAMEQKRLRDDSRRSNAELRKLNQLLADKNAKLELMADRAQRFVDDVSHEFRTPLTVIKEFASIVSDGLAGEVSEKQAEYLQIIDHAVIDLNQMVEDFLDSSKLRTGTLRIDRRRHDVSKIFSDLHLTVSRKATMKSITIKESIAENTPVIFADEEKVRRVITNLLTNAIKFSPAGSKIELWAKSTDEGDVLIGVTDHGPGLDKEELTQIFQRFHTFHNKKESGIKSFGLGLNIAKELVWLNLGKMHVQSTKNKGSTFSFTVPTCDPTLILKRFVERLQEAEGIARQLILLNVSCPSDAGAFDAVRSFLAETTYANDIILRCEDKSMLLLIGPSAEPNSWTKRLKSAAKKNREELPHEELPHFEVSIVGSWPFPASSEKAIQTALKLKTGDTRCV